MQRLVVLDHRSAGARVVGYDENTVEAFRWSLESGYGIETDIRMRADGAIVMKHDPLTQGEMAREAPLPTIDDFFALLKEYTDLQCGSIALHLKVSEQTLEMIEMLAAKIQEYGLQDTVFVFDLMEPALKQFRELDPAIQLSISVCTNKKDGAPSIYTIKEAKELTEKELVDRLWLDEWVEEDKLYTPENLAELASWGKPMDVINADVARQNGHNGDLLEQVRFLASTGTITGYCTDNPDDVREVLEKEVAHERA